MRKVTAAEYKVYQDSLAKNGGEDPLEASRKKAQAQQASQSK